MIRRIACSALTLAAVLAPETAIARDVPVSTTAELSTAITAAKPGDVIILAAGTYAMTGATCSAAGTATDPIVVKSATPLGAKIKMDALEGFHVTAPNWHFEGLDVTGVCADDSNCEHAFHVVGAATGFVLRGSRVFDFNAQVKVNSDKPSGTWITPHAGLIEGNEFGDSHPRNTSNPTTKVNIDTGDGWIVRANYIHDAHKGAGDGTSYAAFMKSGGKNGLFERNLVICSKDDTTGGTRIGLSFGGGGTDPAFCSPAFDSATPCDPEHTGGTMRNNVIVNCSDVGIYLNKSKDTKILFNTLIATNGVDFRFASTTGEADGNVLASKIRGRDGGTFTAKTNLMDVVDFTSWYVDPMNGNLKKKGDLSSLLQKVALRADVPDDYCARARSDGKLDLGALEHTLGDCDTTRPPLGGVTPGDAGADASTGDASPGDASPDSTPTADAVGFDSALPDSGSCTERCGQPCTGSACPINEGQPTSSGCGCRVPTSNPRSGLLAIIGLGLAVAVRRARARRQ